MDAQTLFMALGAVLGIITLIASASVFIKGSSYKGAIEALQVNNTALQDRVSIVEGENGRLTTRVESLERENAILLSQRPSHDLLLELGKQLNDHHIQTMDMLGRRPNDRPNNGKGNA